jgi:hypothetical protein
MNYLIQNDNGVIEEIEACNFPDGCIVSGKYRGIRFYGIVNCGHIDDGSARMPYLKEYIDIKLHDIINPDTGESTHVKMWMATDNQGHTRTYYRKPIWRKWEYYDKLGWDYVGKNICGQTWKDDPREVWIKL